MQTAHFPINFLVKLQRGQCYRKKQKCQEQKSQIYHVHLLCLSQFYYSQS